MKPINSSTLFLVLNVLVTLVSLIVPRHYCQAQNFDQEIKLVSSPSNYYGGFGSSVAVSGDFAIVSEPGANNGNDKKRAVCIFQKTADGTWTQVQKIYDPSQLSSSAENSFGSTVALQGDVALVGARNTTISNPGGSVYVIKRQNDGEWKITQTLVPSNLSNGAQFGCDLSFSGEYVAIGAKYNNVGAYSRVGSVFIYQMDQTGNLSLLERIVHQNYADSDGFGTSVSISKDWLIVGAIGDDYADSDGTYTEAGAAYVFKRNSDNTWGQQQKLVISNRLGGQFGFSVSLDGDAAVIGAPYERYVTNEVTTYGGGVHFFAKNGSDQWIEVKSVFSPTPSPSYDNLLFGRFGNGVSLSGNFAVVSAHNDIPVSSETPRPLPYQGCIYVYERKNEGWAFLKKITASDSQQGDNLANSDVSRNLAIHDQQIIAGANFVGPSATGAVYLFHNGISVSAGTEQSVICGNSINLSANNPAFGQTGIWTIQSGDEGSLADPSSPTSLFSGVAGSTYVLRWTVFQGVFSAYDETRITLSRTAAYAGPDQIAGMSCGRISLAGNAPALPNSYGYWSVSSASEEGTFSNFYDNTDPVTEFFGTDGVTYVLRWTISDGIVGGCTVYDEVTVKYTEEAATASAGPDLVGAAICGQNSVMLGASEPYSGTGKWSIVSGTGGVLADENSPTSSFSGITGNAYTLKWMVSKPPCPVNEDQVEIYFNVPLSVAVDQDEGDGSTGFQEAVIINDQCRIIAKVNGGQQYDSDPQISAKVSVDAAVKTFGGQPYLQRHFDIHPVNLSEPEIYEASVTLYVSQAEFTAFNAASTVQLPANTADIENYKTNLRIWQWHGTPTTNPSVPGSYTGSMADPIDPADVDIRWVESLSAWEIKFNVIGFSGFYITAENAQPLPVTLVHFSAQRQENTVALNWQTTEETNSDYFEIQHSTNGKQWSPIGQVPSAGESNALQHYTYNHSNPVPGENLYRMKMVDRDATLAMSRIVSVVMESAGSLSVFPNPATATVIATSTTPISSYQLLTTSGRIVSERSKVGTMRLELSDLPVTSGLYILKITLGNGKTEHRKLVVK